MIALLDRVILDVGLCFSSLRILLASPFLPAKFLLRNQLIVLWELLCRELSPFPLLLFKILSLSLVLGNLIMMCLGLFLLGSNLLGLSELPALACMSISFARLGKFSFIIFSKKISISCFSYSPSGTPMIQMLEHLKLSWRFLSLSSFFCILVSSLCSGWMFISSFWSKPLI